jgi:P27 family predicted phage terminase small subunit
MKPGPPKQPTAIRLLRGNPSKKAVTTAEPKPPAGVPTKPAGLPVDAGVIWDSTIALLADVPGLLTVADGPTVELFARTLARYRALEAFTEANGPVLCLRDDKGAVRFAQPSPQASLSAKLLPQIRGLAAELGLSPSARTRINLPAAPVADELTRFLAKGRQ